MDEKFQNSTIFGAKFLSSKVEKNSINLSIFGIVKF